MCLCCKTHHSEHYVLTHCCQVSVVKLSSSYVGFRSVRSQKGFFYMRWNICGIEKDGWLLLYPKMAILGVVLHFCV